MSPIFDFERGRLIREHANAVAMADTCSAAYDTALAAAIAATDLRTTSEQFDLADRAQRQLLQASGRLRRLEAELARLGDLVDDQEAPHLPPPLAAHHGDAA